MVGDRVAARIMKACYLITNHHRRVLPISSANSTKAITRAAMSPSFVFSWAARSFQYAPSISSYARPLADADSLASSLSRSNSDAR